MIKKRRLRTAFNDDEIKDIVNYGMLRGMAYFINGKGKLLDSNIIDYILKEFSTQKLRKMTANDRMAKIFKNYKPKIFYEQDYEHIDLNLDFQNFSDLARKIYHLVAIEDMTLEKARVYLKVSEKEFWVAANQLLVYFE